MHQIPLPVVQKKHKCNRHRKWSIWTQVLFPPWAMRNAITYVPQKLFHIFMCSNFAHMITVIITWIRWCNTTNTYLIHITFWELPVLPPSNDWLPMSDMWNSMCMLHTSYAIHNVRCNIHKLNHCLESLYKHHRSY